MHELSGETRWEAPQIDVEPEEEAVEDDGECTSLEQLVMHQLLVDTAALNLPKEPEVRARPFLASSPRSHLSPRARGPSPRAAPHAHTASHPLAGRRRRR